MAIAEQPADCDSRALVATGSALASLITEKLNKFRDVAQLVARLLWEQDAAGSNPVISTIQKRSLRLLFCMSNILTNKNTFLAPKPLVIPKTICYNNLTVKAEFIFWRMLFEKKQHLGDCIVNERFANTSRDPLVY